MTATPDSISTDWWSSSTPVSQLLEVMVETEPLREEDVRVIAASREHFQKNLGAGVSFEEFAAECGFSMDQILDDKK